MKKFIVALLLSGIAGCNDPGDGIFVLEGHWKGTNWYCSNPSACTIKPEDVAATLTFSISKVGEHYAATSGFWNKPSCTHPCSTGLWAVSTINFDGTNLTIEWTQGFSFEGTRDGNGFRGRIVDNQNGYAWNGFVELRKN